MPLKVKGVKDIYLERDLIALLERGSASLRLLTANRLSGVGQSEGRQANAALNKWLLRSGKEAAHKAQLGPVGPVLLRKKNYANVTAKSQQQSRCNGYASTTHGMAI